MARSTFVYVIYLAARPETVWRALLDGEFTRKYWGHENVSDWKPGSPWEHRRLDPERTVALLGQVLEAEPPRRLVMTWADPGDRREPRLHSRVTFELDPVADMVRLTVTHDELEPGSEMQRKITQGWPRVLSSLKSLLETGRALDTWADAAPLAKEPIMSSAGAVLGQFYDAVIRRDMAKARTFVADDMVFVGLFETYPNADAYLRTFTQLMSIVKRLEVKTIIGEGDQAAIFLEMETGAPAAATTLVAEWHQLRNGKIVRAQSAFDGRPFAAMFSGG
jgi:uncharacterized protein YndB with AHSA1/START domain